jgi:hypothetical protein
MRDNNGRISLQTINVFYEDLEEAVEYVVGVEG